MKILVTAGNTQTPIDQVRCITNIFTGRTGAKIALEAARQGHDVHHLTSHPEVLTALAGETPAPPLRVSSYRTFDDLSDLMARTIPGGGFDVIIHAAAVSDYTLAGVFAPGPSGLVDVAAGKVKSSHPELWLKLTPTAKLVDRIRDPWGFRGRLVKFKLEVGPSEEELLAIAEKSRLQSQADFMVANTLEGCNEWALVGPFAGRYERVSRAELARRVLELVDGVGTRQCE